MIRASALQKDFPQLSRVVNGKKIVYLDSTATSLKPNRVIAKEMEYYTTYCANIFRGIYSISEEATAEYERTRSLMAGFIDAPRSEDIIFTRNTTESINLIAYSYGLSYLKKGDRILTTIMEHHSNFVPWQQLGKDRGWELDIWYCSRDGELLLDELEKKVTKKTKIVALTAVSNVLGVIVPVAEIVRAVKRINPSCIVLVDAAQAVPHMPISVKEWGADVVAFSSHKMLGPTGVGVLWVKQSLLECLPPFLYGGEMISEVSIEKTVFKHAPHKFEAGTPDIAGVIGLGAAVEYLQSLGMDAIRRHEIDITSYALKELSRLPGIQMYGPTESAKRGGVIAFTIEGIHPHDIAQLADEDAVCIRSGSHCAMPLHQYFQIAATARASFYIYTTKDDVDALVNSLEKTIRIFHNV